MEHPWYIYVLALVGSLIAGGVNSVAGNGSAITLSILTELLGLPGNLANGTNRIGVLLNGIGSTWGFYKGGKLDVGGSKHILVTMTLGALAGVLIAINISNEQFMGLFRTFMVAMLVVILVNPRRWLIKARRSSVLPRWLLLVLYFILGVYGGLIQMGLGVFMIAVLVLVDGYPLIHANAIKVLAISIFTVFMIAIFAYRGLIEWQIGFVLGIGQFVGGLYTARLASRHAQADKWAYALLVIIVVASIMSLFGVF